MLSEPNISYKPFWGICRPLNSWRANSPNPIQIYCALNCHITTPKIKKWSTQKRIDRFFRSHLVLVGYTASGICTFIYIIHNTLLKSRSILCFFCSTKNSYQLLEKSHLLLYKAKIETIHPKSLIITFAMKPLYLKHIYKLLKSFFSSARDF